MICCKVNRRRKRCFECPNSFMIATTPCLLLRNQHQKMNLISASKECRKRGKEKRIRPVSFMTPTSLRFSFLSLVLGNSKQFVYLKQLLFRRLARATLHFSLVASLEMQLYSLLLAKGTAQEEGHSH